jgi:hypothetical protein
VRRLRHPVKILGSGELSTKLTVHAHAFSKRAVELIEGAGGTAVVIGAVVEPEPEPAKPRRKASKPAAAEAEAQAEVEEPSEPAQPSDPEPTDGGDG